MLENQYTEPDGNDDYVHQTLGYDKTNTIIIIIGSVMILLLLPAIVILALLLTCRVRSLRIKPQK